MGCRYMMMLPKVDDLKGGTDNAERGARLVSSRDHSGRVGHRRTCLLVVGAGRTSRRRGVGETASRSWCPCPDHSNPRKAEVNAPLANRLSSVWKGKPRTGGGKGDRKIACVPLPSPFVSQKSTCSTLFTPSCWSLVDTLGIILAERLRLCLDGWN